MEKTAHTPGPWLAGQTITAPHPERAPGSYDRITIAQRVNRLADARLIAAAPELLGELIKITDAYAQAMKDAGVTHYPEALVVVREARAAIAKARGE